MTTAITQDITKYKPTVLVVDDEAGPRDALKVILRPFFNIQAAESASAALDVLNNQQVDLITLDQRLPDRQGIDLLQEIKHDHSNVEVIIITGYGSLKSAMDGIRHGAAGYLLKPFNVTELVTLVNQTLAKKQRLDFLRTFIHSSPGWWDKENECRETWSRLQAGYGVIGKSGSEPSASMKEGMELLPLFSDLLEAKDRHLLNHCSRVSFYATLLGNRINLSSNEQKSLALGAFLHDIGQIALDNDHFAQDAMTALGTSGPSLQHTEVGAKLVAPLGLPAEVGQIISYHHERWDGSGYPHGLSGEGIPLLARIVSLAQTFDHLTADLPDRDSLAIEDACMFMTAQAGRAFAPTLIPVFTQVVQECKASLPAMAIASSPSQRSDH
ncbi:putative Response regulator with HD domain [Nitrospira sp. KM1]|uniref:HD domain-containing phosphohydrolase n=1 Tax=Nitrospira sp. KM1 TaxID=1936990 RepID=UPI0013A78F83|nr:HD domain-containing phosphohydrolase [Nitrospira sp. KM1]BCA57029.1 putative Response regulator with HD domain [Nitrospira sp. KM1]